MCSSDLGLLDVPPLADGTLSPITGAYALHTTAAMNTGFISSRPGPVMASADRLLITVLQSERMNDDGSAVQLAFAGMDRGAALDERSNEVEAGEAGRFAMDGNASQRKTTANGIGRDDLRRHVGDTAQAIADRLQLPKTVSFLRDMVPLKVESQGGEQSDDFFLPRFVAATDPLSWDECELIG